MLKYRRDLKAKARNLRARMTDAEQLLWSRLRRKQILGVQFYRQKPVGDYIVDFYAPAARLVIEVDGSQHLGDPGAVHDRMRTVFLQSNSLQVLRFDNLQVLQEVDAVMQAIHQAVEKALHSPKSPLGPPFAKGGMSDVGDSQGAESSDIPPFEKGGRGGI
jgi:very-short-patch-repair endonuclease